jgi:hypothetical protein
MLTRWSTSRSRKPSDQSADRLRSEVAVRIDQYRTFEDHVAAIALGVIGGLIVSALGAWDIARRDVV